jgi:hypothetical protein
MSIDLGTETEKSLALTTLSDQLGELLEPTRVDELEAEIKPQSLQKLTPETAKWLLQFMKATEEGLGVTRYVYCELPILWVVDKNGDIWFAVEEIVSIVSRQFSIPRLRNTGITDGHARLGHPALLGASSGRIGGEIIFDVRAKHPSWFISNASGRYGLRRGRRPEHLSKAREKFDSHGINLSEHFIPGRV